MTEDGRFPVRTEKCDSCLYRLKYDRKTRARVLGDAAAKDGYVSCHCHARDEAVCCRGYYDAVGEAGGTPLQLALRLERLMPGRVIRWVEPGELPPRDDEEDDDDE